MHCWAEDVDIDRTEGCGEQVAMLAGGCCGCWGRDAQGDCGGVWSGLIAAAGAPGT